MAKVDAFKHHEIGRFLCPAAEGRAERQISLRSDGKMLGRHRNAEGRLTDWRIVGTWDPLTNSRIKSLRFSGWSDIPKKAWEAEL